MLHFVKRFLQLEAAGGLVLMASAAFALYLANSPFSSFYDGFLAWDMEINIGGLFLSSPLSLVVNDGLMTIFFFMVALEIKREMIEGELSTRAKALFPVATALGGVALPAVFYLALNAGTDGARGWAIASATDIAFSLGVLSLFGSRVPSSLKIFLMALAVIDDLVAILIIALFYTNHLETSALIMAAVCTLVLLGLNRSGVERAWPYIFVGILLWVAVHHSGVHATMAGVVLGMLIPMKKKDSDERPMGIAMMEKVHPWVAFGIMPLFGFVNAGISLSGLTLEHLAHPVSAGIVAGLFFGKQLGIAGTAAFLVFTRLASLPEQSSWRQFYAVSILAGIGFTMSLFIGELAFDGSIEKALVMKLGIIIGSLLSAVIGCVLMAIAVQTKQRAAIGE